MNSRIYVYINYEGLHSFYAEVSLPGEHLYRLSTEELMARYITPAALAALERLRKGQPNAKDAAQTKD